MTEILKNKITIGNVIEIVLILCASIWVIAFIQSDLNQIKKQQEKIPEIYVRKDVITPQLEALKEQLDRIEKKIDRD